MIARWRRERVLQFLLVGVLLFGAWKVALFGLTSAAAADQKQPNIVFIPVDNAG